MCDTQYKWDWTYVLISFDIKILQIKELSNDNTQVGLDLGFNIILILKSNKLKILRINYIKYKIIKFTNYNTL